MERKGEAIAVHTQDGVRIAGIAVMRVLLCLSLLAAFTGFAAAAFCLQPHHQGPAGAGHNASALMIPGRDDGSGPAVAAFDVQAPTAACCRQEDGPLAVTAYGRSLTTSEALALTAVMEIPWGAVAFRLSGLLYPAPERTDRFRPTLASLSVSRT
ncbi:hypothetical protein [Paenarthrobacter ureafaciens]|uniref:hypothetical protein n=1 Tax=Paenarthrobacter ureafaciens TaxID=37931 RepID=UPI00140796FF|nr:hypothetical protein [Paenarthrobacter ureafaciens]MCX8454840.1 hypothetical protein [Paenarthrobacter ureafaciens]MCY0975579.1 hypothetical protein [Paenarthrobacter ureafaciens]